EYLGVPPKLERETVGVPNNLIRVPNVRNFSVEEASRILTKAGLSVRIAGEGSIVIDQIPKPTAAVASGTTVILETSPLDPKDSLPLGENEADVVLKVPRVLGLTMAEAAAV